MTRGHKGANTSLTAERLREVLAYDQGTGLFTWKVTLSKRAVAGKAAGWVQTSGKTRRIKIAIANTEYMAHRLAWLWMTGEWPEYEVDHEDTDGTNNKWKNLRHATSSQNLCNRGAPSNNTSGYKGVCCETRSGKFLATIKASGKQIYLGRFSTAEAAHAAYVKAANKLHGEFAKVS